MAHYNVNAGVPKTLMIQHLIRWTIATGKFPGAVLRTLDAILATEISPELIPAGEGEKLRKALRAKIGPYALQDFTLFYILRYGFLPSKIAFMALHAWEDPARGNLAATFPAVAEIIRSANDPVLDGRVPAPVFRLQPVQAERDAEWAESVGRRVTVTARRLAGAVGWQCGGMACGAGEERAAGVKSQLD